MRSVLVVLGWLLLASSAAWAQEQSTSVQIAGEFSGLGLDRASSDRKGAAGVGVRIDVGLTRRVDVESRVTWFPANAFSERESQGGQTLQVAAGIRGKFVMSRRASFYGLLLPGLLHFSNAITTSNDVTVTGGATHFALDTGLGLELYPTSRWTVRGEVSGPLYGAPGAELARSSPSATGAVAILLAPARFVNPWQVSAGIGYRLGALRESPREESVLGRWEIGGALSHATSTDALSVGESFYNISALGAFVSYRVAHGTYADAALNAFLHPAPQGTLFDGGHLLQGLAGVKIGLRKDRYGFFVKARAGVNSHSGALTGFDTATLSVTVGRSNATAIDLGGVFERYVSRHLLIRFDGGDVISVFHATTISQDGVRVTLEAPTATHGPQMSVGAGWRF